MSYLDHVKACNRATLENFIRFRVAGIDLGWIRRRESEHLRDYPEIFTWQDNAVTLNSDLDEFDARSEAIASVTKYLTRAGLIPTGEPEFYPATTAFDATPYFKIDRAAAPFFGLRAFGVHVNGFVRGADGARSLWIGRRGTNVRVCPGMLDNMVAGGQPIGLGLLENVVKEAEEEAGVPTALAQQATAVGSISYVMETQQGLRPDTMFCFDLEVPDGFQPACQDGSVVAYYLWPLEKVAEIVEHSFDFKFNCNLVIIDFLMRHGFISTDHPEYSALIDGLGR